MAKLIFLLIVLVSCIPLRGQENAVLDSLIAQAAVQKDSARLKTLYELFTHHVRNNTETSKLYLDTLRAESRTQENPAMKALANKALGLYHYNRSEYREARSGFEISANIYDSLGLKADLARVLNNLGIVQKYLGRYEAAADSHLRSLSLKRELGLPPSDIVASLGNLGVLQWEMGNLKRSTAYYREVLDLSLEHKLERSVIIARSNLAGNYEDMGEFERALQLYMDVLADVKKTGDIRSVARMTNSIGALYFKMDSLDIAKSYYLEANALNRKHGLTQYEGLSTRNLGKVAMRENNYQAALEYFLRAREISLQTGTLARNVGDHLNISEAYAALGDYQTAYAYRKTHFDLYDSIFNKEKTEQISELEIRYDTERKEADLALQKAEIKTLNARARADKLSKSLYAGGMVSFVAVSGLLFFGFRQRIKKNRIAREKQEEIYKKEIDHKSRELASQTLHMVQKNTFLEELMDNLSRLKSNPSQFKVEFRRIVMLLRKEKASDKDWEVFKSYFAEVHNDFDQKLKTLKPDLSEKEIRLAAFLRMKLTTKEIAATMNVLPDSVLTSKYRLKKRLGLDKETDLNEFLESL